MILAVDLASKFSAAILRDDSGGVDRQFDSRDKTALAFCQEVAQAAVKADLIVIEDVPYGISNQAMVKPVLRLQGAITAYLTALGAVDRTLFLVPSVWMKDYPGVQLVPKGYAKAAADTYRIEQARMYAEKYGYAPPDLVADYLAVCEASGKKVLKKNTGPLAKSQTDYVSAFLMSEYVRPFTMDELLAKPGAQRASL